MSIFQGFMRVSALLKGHKKMETKGFEAVAKNMKKSLKTCYYKGLE